MVGGGPLFTCLLLLDFLSVFLSGSCSSCPEPSLADVALPSSRSEDARLLTFLLLSFLLVGPGYGLLCLPLVDLLLPFLRSLPLLSDRLVLLDTFLSPLSPLSPLSLLSLGGLESPLPGGGGFFQQFTDLWLPFIGQ